MCDRCGSFVFIFVFGTCSIWKRKFSIWKLAGKRVFLQILRALLSTSTAKRLLQPGLQKLYSRLDVHPWKFFAPSPSKLVTSINQTQLFAFRFKYATKMCSKSVSKFGFKFWIPKGTCQREEYCSGSNSFVAYTYFLFRVCCWVNETWRCFPPRQHHSVDIGHTQFKNVFSRKLQCWIFSTHTQHEMFCLLIRKKLDIISYLL